MRLLIDLGAAAGVLGGTAAAARQAEDAQVRLGEVQTAATADGQQVGTYGFLRSPIFHCSALFVKFGLKKSYLRRIFSFFLKVSFINRLSLRILCLCYL